jgi:hypothetical protein
MKRHWTVALLLFVLVSCSPHSTQPVTFPISTVQATASLPADASAPATPTPISEEKNAESSAEEIVKELIAAKLDAMEAKDVERYLALVDETDREYYTEQRNWFLIYQDAVTFEFTIDVLEAEKVSDDSITAKLHQHYFYGPQKEDRTITYEERYVKTSGGWKDADLNFKVTETPHFVIKYPQEADTQARIVASDAENAYSSVVQELQLEPQAKTTIKLYEDQEMLRQSTDIQIAYLFNGWGEAGESIKMYAYRETGSVSRLIAHELVHKITLEITDSQTSWLAEGMATYFGNRPFQSGDALQLGVFTVQELSKPISWLEEKDLGQLTDEKTIRLYYAVSGMVVEFIVKNYGLDKLHALLIEMAKYPRYDRGYDYAMEPDYQQRLYQAMEIVFGVNKDRFNKQWLAWVSSQSHSALPAQDQSCRTNGRRGYSHHSNICTIHCRSVDLCT